MKVVQFFVCSSTKSVKVIFLLVSFQLIVISMVRIIVLACWKIFFCVWPISPVSTMLFVLVELVCILKYKLNRSYLCLTHRQFLSSLMQTLSTSERITGVVECLHHEIRKI